MMKSKKRLIAAITANGLIILFEIISLILSIWDWGWEMFQFYTQDSNYLALIASVLFEVFAIRQLIHETAMPKFVLQLRYMAS